MRITTVFIALLLSCIGLARQGSVVPTSLVVETNPTVGGNNIVGRVTLNHFAPLGGEMIQITSDMPSVDMPSAVMVSYGRMFTRFSFTPNGVDSTANYTLHATGNGATVDAPLVVNPAKPKLFYFEPSNILGGINVSGVINLDGAAGPSGLKFNLDSHSTFMTLPATANVAPNRNRAYFTGTTPMVTAPHVINATATTDLGVGLNAQATVDKMRLASIQAYNVTPTRLRLLVRLNGPATTRGQLVNLKCSDPSVYVGSVNIAPKEYTYDWQINYTASSVDRTITFTGYVDLADAISVTVNLSAAQMKSVTVESDGDSGLYAPSLNVQLDGPVGNNQRIPTMISSTTYPYSVATPFKYPIDISYGGSGYNISLSGAYPYLGGIYPGKHYWTRSQKIDFNVLFKGNTYTATMRIPTQKLASIEAPLRTKGGTSVTCLAVMRYAGFSNGEAGNMKVRAVAGMSNFLVLPAIMTVPIGTYGKCPFSMATQAVAVNTDQAFELVDPNGNVVRATFTLTP